jgi:hypothetical protein
MMAREFIRLAAHRVVLPASSVVFALVLLCGARPASRAADAIEVFATRPVHSESAFFATSPIDAIGSYAGYRGAADDEADDEAFEDVEAQRPRIYFASSHPRRVPNGPFHGVCVSSTEPCRSADPLALEIGPIEAPRIVHGWPARATRAPPRSFFANSSECRRTPSKRPAMARSESLPAPRDAGRIGESA